MMEVFRIAPTAAYCGGAAYVAARNVDEAIETFCENDYRKFEYEEGVCTVWTEPSAKWSVIGKLSGITLTTQFIPACTAACAGQECVAMKGKFLSKSW